MTRVMVLADDRRRAAAIGQGLEHAACFQVVGHVSARPEIVVIDDAAGTGSALGRIRGVRLAVPGAKVVLLAPDVGPERMREARAAGMDAAIARSVDPDSVGTLLREITKGRVYHPPADAQSASAGAQAASGGAAPPLTPRELEILRLVAAGAPNGLVARELWITEQTVKFHLSNAYRKLRVANRTQASHYAHTHGLLEQPDAKDSTPRPAAPVLAA
jgi:DNA-binding NarL/FixJ family response regulator